jgi:hypothetical protein
MQFLFKRFLDIFGTNKLKLAVFGTMSVHAGAFLFPAPCVLASEQQSRSGTEDGVRMILRNIGIHVPDCLVLQTTGLHLHLPYNLRSYTIQ